MIALARTDQEKVAELACWALAEGDDDILRVCSRALSGDVAMHEEAVSWWGAWAGLPRCPAHGSVHCLDCLEGAIASFLEPS